MPLRPKSQAGPSAEPALWCAICRVVGKHAIDNYHLLQKFVQIPQQLFCNFSKSVGNDEHICRSYELMMDRTPTYRVQAKTQSLDQSARMAWTGFQGRERGRGGGGPGRGRGQLIFYNCGGLGHYPTIALIQRIHCESIAHYLIMKHKTALC